ncbi:MAG: 4-alpha-glucanotransferase, partial [Burkholderiales bacterium]|nr:4-alpha-glucanotransferase [Burkholderiales bacterium]
LTAERGRIFRELVVDAIGPAGAFRIDHAMSMARLYLIADGLDGTDGAYVHFPFDDMLKAVAAASQDTHAIIIGEDLGTVPANFRETLQAAGIQGYRVLFFERAWDRSFHLPASYERHALACISTHDLPTLSGWWEGTDIDDREHIGLDNADVATATRASRDTDRKLMLAALAASGLLPDDLGPALRGEHSPPKQLPRDVAVALSRFLARTPCRLVAIQLEDLAAMTERMNLPGTINEQPNWRRKLPLDLAPLFASPNLIAIMTAVAEERPRPKM